MGRIRGGGPNDAGCIEAIATWVQSLHGRGGPLKGLSRLAGAFGANGAGIMRYGSDRSRPRVVAQHSAQADLIPPVPMCPPLAADILGQAVGSLEPGALWVQSENGELSSTADRLLLIEKMQAHGLADAALILLDDRAGDADILELHFDRSVARADAELMEVLGRTLARTWQARPAGRATRWIAVHRAHGLHGRPADPAQSILDIENPAGLSRCEYRVCVLLRDGLPTKRIARELDVCESTVRSHLRAIYAKTQTAGQLELLHRLSLTPAGERALSA